MLYGRLGAGFVVVLVDQSLVFLNEPVDLADIIAHTHLHAIFRRSDALVERTRLFRR